MLEIKVEYNGTYYNLDLFGEEGVDMTLLVMPTFEIESAFTDYTDSFDLPLTLNNKTLILPEEDQKCTIISGDFTIKGYLTYNSSVYYTPNKKISVSFMSEPKYIIDKMKVTPFADLFKNNGEPDIQPTGTAVINDINYGFTMDEDGAFMDDGLTVMTVNNFFDATTTSPDTTPLYAYTKGDEFNSMHFTFKLETLLTSLLAKFEKDVIVQPQIITGHDNDTIGIRIPTPLLASASDRTITGILKDNEYGDYELQTYTQPQPTNSLHEFITEQENGVTGHKYGTVLMQHETEYNITLAEIGISSAIFCTLHYDTGSHEYTVSLTSTSHDFQQTGNIFPAVALMSEGQVLEIFKPDTIVNVPIDGTVYGRSINGEVTIVSEIGDNYYFKQGLYADNASVYIPTDYNTLTLVWSGSQEVIMDGWLSTGSDDYTMSTPDGFTVTYSSSGDTFIGEMKLAHGVHFDSPWETDLDFTPVNDNELVRYGDDISLNRCYSGSDLTMLDVVQTIMKRFNLNLKYDTDTEVFVFNTEDSFYNNNYLIIDHKVNEAITQRNEYVAKKDISFLNEDYGNINDANSIKDKKLTEDIIKDDFENGELESFEYSYGSSLQNKNVYGAKSSVGDTSFLRLENNRFLWKYSRNEHISQSSLPITFGQIVASDISPRYRLPRAVRVTTLNYPNATDEARTANLWTVVTEHTLITPIGSVTSCYELDGDLLTMVDNNNKINHATWMYDNWEGYIKRISLDEQTIEAEVYLTNAEIKLITEGDKITMFGETFNPIKLSGVEIEKEGSVVSIVMSRNDTNPPPTAYILTQDGEILTCESGSCGLKQE